MSAKCKQPLDEIYSLSLVTVQSPIQSLINYGTLGKLDGITY